MSILGRSVVKIAYLSEPEFAKKVGLAESLINDLVREIKTSKTGSKTSRKWPYKAPEGFLRASNLIERPLSPIEQVKECTRCSTAELATGIQAALVHFVCLFCFRDTNAWAFKGKGDAVPYTQEAMKYQSPEMSVPDGRGGKLFMNNR